MTAAQRDAVRAARDAAVRARVAAERAAGAPCRGCGCHLDEWTPGCRACGRRHYFRRADVRDRHNEYRRYMASIGRIVDHRRTVAV